MASNIGDASCSQIRYGLGLDRKTRLRNKNVCVCVCVCVCVHVLCAALAEKARDNYKCVRAQLFSVCSQLLPDHS